MVFHIFCIGKVKDAFYRDEINSIQHTINGGHHSLQITEFPDCMIPEHMSEERKEQFLEEECRPIRKELTGQDYIIALCIEGKEYTSQQHWEQIDKAKDMGYERIVYLIGGSLGLPESLKRKAHVKLSFSKLTFPHQMMRMVLCEAIWRML